MPPTYNPGYYPTESFPISGASFYNVSGKVGANLTIIVVCTYTDPNIIIWSPNGTHLGLAFPIAPHTQMVSTICDSNLFYTIEVSDPDAGGGPGEYAFTLTIQLPNGNPSDIPGFDFLFICFGFLTALGLIIFTLRRKTLPQ